MRLEKQLTFTNYLQSPQHNIKEVCPMSCPTEHRPPISVHKRSPWVDQTKVIKSLVDIFAFGIFRVGIFINVPKMCLLDCAAATKTLLAKLTVIKNMRELLAFTTS